MLSTIAECINIYSEIKKYKYIFTLDNNEVISVRFASKHFHHLVGLHKLTDIPQVQVKPNVSNTSSIFRQLKNKKINEQSLKKSIFYNKITDRIAYFDTIPSLLRDCKFIVDFDHEKLPFDSELENTKYILYKRLNNGRIIHLTMVIDNIGIINPETFFVHPNNDYLSEQKLLSVTDIKIEKIKTKPV